MKKKISSFVSVLVILSLILGVSIQRVANATVPGFNALVSINSTGDGQGGNGNSPSVTSTKGDTTISANGKYVVFTSHASNLVSGDTNSKSDVFVRDLANNTTERVNVSSSGVQANDNVASASGKLAAISGTGRYVIFASRATNLIDGQTISSPQIYMRDTLTNTTTVVSQKSDGTLGSGSFDSIGGVSDDGRFVTWVGTFDTGIVSTEANTQSYYVYFADLKTRTFTVLNHTAPTTGQYFVGGVAMNCDGSLIAFASKLQLDTSDTDSADDVYMVDTRNGLSTTGITTTSSTNSFNSVLPSLSCNGEYVVFESKDTSLITSGPVPTSNDHQYLYDRINGTITLVDTSTTGVVGNNSSNSTAGVDDQGNVVFSSTATNLIDGSTLPVSQVYLKHGDTGQTELVSRRSGGSTASNAFIYSTSLSARGKTTVYATDGPAATATNLIPSDTNGFKDVIASSTGL
jgi:hypothetical protein